MKSVRLDPELESQLKEAAELTGEPISQIVRDALRHRCNELLGDRLDRRLADVIGSVGSGWRSHAAEHTGRAFTEIVKRRLKGKK